jgi:hypothetical protein
MASGEGEGRRDDARELARRLEAWGRERSWRGSDPYDGLNARRALLRPLQRGALGRRLLIQTVKRSPIDLRSLLAVRPAASAASLAWVVSAYSRGGFLSDDERHSRLRLAIRQLQSLRCRGFEAPCWGYHFDVQSRVFFYSSSTPNTIATGFAGLALLDAHTALEDEELLDQARSVGDFFLAEIPQTEADPGAYFGYLPGDRSPIHNSNLLVASLLARLAGASGEERFAAAAVKAATYSVARQRPDGSWPYGERPNLGWVDGFHTGYVLDALRACVDVGGGEIEQAWRRGLAYYRRHLFLDDGTPKYYAQKVHPIDAQCASQGIQTLAIAAAHEPLAEELAWKVFAFVRRRMIGSDGLPVFQLRRHWSNQTPHPRWVVAPMLLALSHLLRAGERPRTPTSRQARPA